jgi:hypothetical protein
MSARPPLSQRQRNKDNPVNLGKFDRTSLRLITGGLGPKYKRIGYKDTGFQSNGGIGGGTYNAWFQLELAFPAWIILTKGSRRPDWFQVSCYNMNKNPIEGRMIWQKDGLDVDGYFPYTDHVMGAGSDLYNTYDPKRLDKGDELYYVLSKGKYLICISSTRNEDIDYEVGLVVEFADQGPFFIRCEDNSPEVIMALENDLNLANTETIFSPITTDQTIGPVMNAFTEKEAEIIPNSTTVTVEATGTLENRATWWIGTVPSGEDKIELDINPNWTSTFHSHSLTEWETAWRRDHKSSEAFPAIFVPLTDQA